MNVQEIDKNLTVGDAVCKDGMAYYTIPDDRFALHGVFYDEKTSRFMRLDGDVAAAVSEGVSRLAQHTAGGRLRFSTDSAKLTLTVTYDGMWIMPHMAMAGANGFMLVEENEDGETGFFKMLPPTADQTKGYTISADLPTGKMRQYILYFPLYNRVTGLTVGLEETARVGRGRAYKDVKPILYYGSSITQGACATRPDNCYQALIAKWNNVDFINLGFSGSGKAEDLMVDYLAGVDCSLFVCDYDHNAPDAAYLAATHWRLYERYRRVRPDVPILFLSAPSVFDRDAVRKGIIRRTYLRARRAGDRNVYFLDGGKLFGDRDRENCTVDGTHPTDLGFYRMAEKIYRKLVEIDGVYAK